MNKEAERLAFRRTLRRSSPDAERRLWRVLKAKRLSGFKFRRQHPAGRYVLDFFCPAAALAVEADGGQHFTPEGVARDAARTAYLACRGIAVLRFTDREILLEQEAVIEVIWREATQRTRRRG